MFGVATIAAIALLAAVLGPPVLGKPPDPSIIAADPRPDWYLLWYFALLALIPHGIENYFMVFGPVLAGVVLFLLPFLRNRGERSDGAGELDRLDREPGDESQGAVVAGAVGTDGVDQLKNIERLLFADGSLGSQTALCFHKYIGSLDTPLPALILAAFGLNGTERHACGSLPGPPVR